MELIYRCKRTGAAKQAICHKNLQRKQTSWPSSILRWLPSRRSSALMPIHIPCGAHFTESCIIARNSITLIQSASLSSLRSILFSSQKSPTFINQSPMTSLHHPYLNHLFHRRQIPDHLRSSSAIHLHQWCTTSGPPRALIWPAKINLKAEKLIIQSYFFTTLRLIKRHCPPFFCLLLQSCVYMTNFIKLL